MTKQSAGHPHGPMRRKEREITDRAEIDAILASEKVMHLALCADNVPFLVPVFFAYDGTALYFHSAPAGSKINILKQNNRVCFEISAYYGVIEDERACDFEAHHRTVIGTGQAVFVEDPEEKIRALNQIVALFTKTQFTFPKPKLTHTTVIRIDIDQLKGKSHGFPKT